MEADLLMFYGVDLLDIGTGWPWRRLRSLLDHLPRESATKRALLGDPVDAEWGLAEQLLAELVDTERVGLWAKADRKKRGRRPEPIERPGRRRKTTKPRLSPDVMARRLLEQQERLAR